MSRSDEIAQGLRHESGCLTFTLIAEEYGQGHADFAAGAAPPKFSTPSYDLGRARASRLAEEKADFLGEMRRDQIAGRERMRQILASRPDVLAEYEAKLCELDASHPQHEGWTMSEKAFNDAPSLHESPEVEPERDATERGELTWHSGGEDEGPDVGLELGLGDGFTLYVGELANATIQEAGFDPTLGSWWITLCSDEEGFQIVGPVADTEAAHLMMDRLFAALQGSRKDGASHKDTPT